MKTFVDALSMGMCINIDDNFIRHYNFEYEPFEEDGEMMLDADAIDGSYNLYEYRFTKAECEAAEYDPITKEWTVISSDEKYSVTVYNLETIGDE